ncbi:MAG: hypothetical protein ACRC92_21230, partial [Peptostreptococcaceae bacterium]
MKKKLISIIISITLLVSVFSHISYAEQNTVPITNLNELKGKDIISKNLKELKMIRNNIDTINIQSDTRKTELEKNKKALSLYIIELEDVRRNLEEYKRAYSDSQVDIFAAELLSFTVETYIIGSRLTQVLIREL